MIEDHMNNQLNSSIFSIIDLTFLNIQIIKTLFIHCTVLTLFLTQYNLPHGINSIKSQDIK